MAEMTRVEAQILRNQIAIMKGLRQLLIESSVMGSGHFASTLNLQEGYTKATLGEE